MINKTTSKLAAKLSLAAVVVAALAVYAARAEVRNAPEDTIERPANRANPAFVPRLGKRLERLLCDNPQECSRLALLGASVKGIIGQDGSASLLDGPQGAPGGQTGLTGSEALAAELGDDLSLLDMMLAQERRLPRREKRDASDGVQGEQINEPSSFIGAKRVAFTPRVGRRR